jgi:hypothetical protein
MKKEELAKCACGGTPKRVKLPNGKARVKCACGKSTSWHGRKAEATKEWKVLAGLPAGTVSEKPKAAKKAAPKAAASLPSPAPAKCGEKDFAIAIAAELALLRTLSEKQTKALDALGQMVVAKFGVGEKEVRELLAKFEPPKAKVVTVEVSPETAKRLLEGLTKTAKAAKPAKKNPAKKGGK